MDALVHARFDMRLSMPKICFEIIPEMLQQNADEDEVQLFQT